MGADKQQKQRRNHTRSAAATGYGWGSHTDKTKPIPGRQRQVANFNLPLLIRDARATAERTWPVWDQICNNPKYIRYEKAESVGVDVDIPNELDFFYAFEVEARATAAYAVLDSLKQEAFSGTDVVKSKLTSKHIDFSEEQSAAIRDHIALHISRSPRAINKITNVLKSYWGPGKQVFLFGAATDLEHQKLSQVLEAHKLFMKEPENRALEDDAWQKALSWKIYENFRTQQKAVATFDHFELVRLDPSDNSGLISLPTTFISGSDLSILEADLRALFRTYLRSKHIDQKYRADETIDDLLSKFVAGPLSSDFLILYMPEKHATAGPCLIEFLSTRKVFEMTATLLSLATTNMRGFAVGRSLEDLKTYYNGISRVFQVGELFDLMQLS